MCPQTLTARRLLRSVLVAIGLVCLLLRPAPAAPPPAAGGEPPFLFGCEWPVDGSPAVKSLFYETGCNFARLTGGGYGWALDRHRRALQELGAHGVKVLLQLGSHYPDGSYFALKDSDFVDQKGQTGKEDHNAWAVTYNGSAWPQYSYASAAFRSKLAVDFTAYLGGLKDQSNVSTLLLHNEPGYHWIDDRVFDYNPQAVTRFRVWLRQRHGSLDALNRRWGSHWTSFDAVEPPRDLPPVAAIAAWLDWRRFQADLIQDFLHEEVAFAHRTLPGVPATTNLSGPLDNWYPIRLGDNYRDTAGMDIAGIDIYPTEWTTPVFPGYAMDMTRGAAQGRPIYVPECEVFDPTRFPGLSEEQRAEMLRSQVWTFIGHGADGVLLWSLSGQEGFRLTHGEFNARVAAVREVAHLAPMLHLGAFQKPAPRVAVCVDQDSFLFYGGREPKLDGGQHADLSARGLYAAVVAGRYQADVVSASQIRQGAGSRYQALLLSLPVLMDAALAARIRAFVAAGGLVVAEAPFAARDRWGQELSDAPGFGLADVLGIRHVHPEQTVGVSADSGPITTPDGVFASQNRTRFQLAGARVVGTFSDKTPAVMVHRFGKGTAIYLAAEVGGPNTPSWAAGPPSGLQTFVAAVLARDAGLQPAVSLTSRGSAFLDASSRRDSRGNQLIVLADPTNRAKPLPPATDVTLAPQDMAPGAQAFGFPPTRHEGGRVTAGPQPLRVERRGTGRPVLALPPIASALPVLLARDFAPLLSISAPETAAAGTEVDVQMTCYNPSPRPLRAMLSLVIPPSWTSLDAPGPVSVPARGSRTVTLRARSGGEARAVIAARLAYPLGDKGTARVDSVPVDIFARPPAP